MKEINFVLFKEFSAGIQAGKTYFEESQGPKIEAGPCHHHHVIVVDRDVGLQILLATFLQSEIKETWLELVRHKEDLLESDHNLRPFSPLLDLLL